GTIYSQPYTPASGMGDYRVKVTVSTGISQPDLTPDNDTLSFFYTVTDSVYARDNNVPDGGTAYAVSTTDWADAVTLFELPSADTLLGIWIQLATPVHMDTTFGVVFNTTTGVPTGSPTSTPVQIIDSTQAIYFLQYTSGVPLAAGLYGFGCYEGANTTINLAQ